MEFGIPVLSTFLQHVEIQKSQFARDFCGFECSYLHSCLSGRRWCQNVVDEAEKCNTNTGTFDITACSNSTLMLHGGWAKALTCHCIHRSLATQTIVVLFEVLYITELNLGCERQLATTPVD